MSLGPKSSSLVRLPGSGSREDELELGFVSGIFGVRGEVRLHLHNRESLLLADGRDVVLVHEASGRRFSAHLQTRPGAGRRVLGRIDGISDRDAAASLQGYRIAIPKAELPMLDPGEFWIWQVEGLPVFVDGERVGHVVTVHETDGGDVFELMITEISVLDPDGRISGERRVFVSSSEERIPVLDLEGGRVEVAPEALDLE